MGSGVSNLAHWVRLLTPLPVSLANVQSGSSLPYFARMDGMMPSVRAKYDIADSESVSQAVIPSTRDGSNE